MGAISWEQLQALCPDAIEHFDDQCADITNVEFHAFQLPNGGAALLLAIPEGRPSGSLAWDEIKKQWRR